MNLTVINHNNQRILTTAQLATSYQTENKVISNNFNRNKDRYKEGKHYFALTDESKRQFINLHQIEDGSKMPTHFTFGQKKEHGCTQSH